MTTTIGKVEKLSASNYPTWKVVMTSQLKGQSLWSCIESPKAEDDKTKDSKEYITQNEQAKTLMYLAMEPHQISATGVCSTAHDLWMKIKENHEGSTMNQRSTALAELLSMNYRKNETVVSFAGRFENTLGKLESTGHTVDEKTKLWVFSNSLPQHLKLTVQMFTMANPDGKVKDLISQMKVQHHLDNKDSDKTVAYQVHEKSHEKPHQQTSDKPQANKQAITCNYCKKPGHVWRECRKLKADNERKKKFGQINQQRQHPSGQHRHQQRSSGPKPSGAFMARGHTFTEGKFTWIIDSGATSHMSPHKEFLTDYVEFTEPKEIIVGDGKALDAFGKGRISFENKEHSGWLTEVYWVPDLSENLFSVCSAMSQGCNVEFNKELSMVLFYKNKEIVLRGRKSETSRYFIVSFWPSTGPKQPQVESAMLGASLEEWHKRLGHCSMDTVKALIKSNAVSGLTVADQQAHECRSCILGKLCRVQHPQRRTVQATEATAVLHIDTVGPMKHTSVGGGRYFVLATEEYSGYKLVDVLGTKASIPDAVKRLINQTELESKRPVKAIVTDNGTEFTNNDLHKWLMKKGIIQLFSASYTPQQNGRAERANRSVLDGIRTLLTSSKLPESLWAEALHNVVYTTNRLPSKRDGTVQTKTRFELLTGQKPNIGNLKVFGQKAIVRESDNARDGKLAPRGDEATFVGYTDRFNTYRFYIAEPVQQVICSCDARFLNGPAKENTSGHKPDEYVVFINNDKNGHEENSTNNSVYSDSDTEVNTEYETSVEESESDGEATEIDEDSTMVEQVSQQDAANRPVTRSVSQLATPKVEPPQTQEKALFTLDNEPRTIKDAQESDDWPNWQKAMDEEIEALKKNRTWELVDKPANARPIKNKWVFKAKLKPDGSIDRYKARLVAKGFTQIPNVDYKETYAPVASMTTVRMFLAIANQCLMHIVQFDVKTAFLYGDLEEELYMEQPDNYQTDPNKVCKLVKSLYGLKQAPRQWNKKFDTFLKHFKLQQSSIDKCLYYSQDRSLLLAIYVDDGLAACKNRKHLDELISYLKENFELKVMDCESFLGFEIKRDFKARTLDITQAHYVDKILDRFGMKDCKPVSTPEEVGASFKESPLLPTDNQFKELIGSLLYLTTCTRPDIAHAVSIASRTSQPTQAHWVALKRILRYLKGSREYGIRFRWENPNELIGYSDADYANDEETRKSTTGYCIYLCGAPIAWRCQRQPIITLSTTEAEYVAGCELVKEILPIREQLIELKQIDDQKPTTVLIDNQSTVRIASNESGQNRTKHIDIREKWLTEQVAKKKIEVKHVSGEEQAADILTKPLYKTKFATNRSKLLTQIMTVLTIMTLIVACPISINCRDLKHTDAITTIPSDKFAVNGDTRYTFTTMFMNPCDNFFNYSTTMQGTEYLIKYCYDYFAKKHLGPLTYCKRQPTIGPDLKHIPLTYNCADNPSSGIANGEEYSGRCDIRKRNSKVSSLPELEISRHQESWNTHMEQVKHLPTYQPRKKRFIPVLAAGALGVALVGVIAGPGYTAYKLSNQNAANIDQLANITELHSKVLKDTTMFFDQYRNSITVLHTWAEEVEERLGDSSISPLYSDPTYKGKRANLVKSYMQWFDAQEKLLLDVNQAAARRKIPASLKSMLNGTRHFETAANLSTLFDCNYRLEDKNLVLELEFSIPTVDETVDILKVEAQDVYRFYNHTDDRGEEYCWERYIGPSYVLLNKTSSCIKTLSKNKADQIAVRGATCLEPRNDLLLNSDLWKQENCDEEAARVEDHIQIEEINGAHKIYCYPYNITIDKQEFECPIVPFILEGHADYSIDKIAHEGDYIETNVTRRVNHSDRSPRNKRSALPPPPVSIGISLNPSPIVVPTTPAPRHAAAEATTATPKSKMSDSLKHLTGEMNATIIRIKDTLKIVPEKLNLTRADLENFLSKPFSAFGDSFKKLMELIESLGSVVSVLSVVMMAVIIMPVLEIVIIGVRIAKIPAGLWIGSAKRVTGNIKSLIETAKSSLPMLSRSKPKRRNALIKMT